MSGRPLRRVVPLRGGSILSLLRGPSPRAQAKPFYHLSVTLCRSPYRHFERSREIFLAHPFSCQMALLVCIFSMRAHTHHFPSCHEDPSTSLGMTLREERYLSSVGANPLPFGHPPSKGRGYDSHPPSSGRRCPGGAEVSLPHV